MCLFPSGPCGPSGPHPRAATCLLGLRRPSGGLLYCEELGDVLLLLPARHGQGQGQPDPRQPGMLATGCMSAGLSTHLGLGLPLTPPEHEVGALGLVVASRLAQVRPILEAVVADLLGEEGGQQQVFAIGCTTRPLPPSYRRPMPSIHTAASAQRRQPRRPRASKAACRWCAAAQDATRCSTAPRRTARGA